MGASAAVARAAAGRRGRARRRAVEQPAHRVHLDLARAVGERSRARVPRAEREVARPQHLRAGHGDQARLDRAEHDAEPGGHLPSITSTRSPRPQPASAAAAPSGRRRPRDSAKVMRSTMPRRSTNVSAAGPVGGERLDDVAHEVEALGNVPRGVHDSTRCASVRRLRAGASAVAASHAPLPALAVVLPHGRKMSSTSAPSGPQ